MIIVIIIIIIIIIIVINIILDSFKGLTVLMIFITYFVKYEK